MFQKVAMGVIAVSTIGLQIWIGTEYKKFLGELLVTEEDSGPEEPDSFDMDAFWDGQIDTLNFKYKNFKENL